VLQHPSELQPLLLLQLRSQSACKLLVLLLACKLLLLLLLPVVGRPAA
jgi:hypothetical protein